MMISAIATFAAFLLLLVATVGIVGFGPVYQVAYLTITLWAGLIAFTFAWLYWKQRTHLALGMMLAWSGAAIGHGWWFANFWLHSPAWMHHNVLVFVAPAVYMAGSVVHFASFQKASNPNGRIWVCSAMASVLISLFVFFLSQ